MKSYWTLPIFILGLFFHSIVWSQNDEQEIQSRLEQIVSSSGKVFLVQSEPSNLAQEEQYLSLTEQQKIEFHQIRRLALEGLANSWEKKKKWLGRAYMGGQLFSVVITKPAREVFKHTPLAKALSEYWNIRISDMRLKMNNFLNRFVHSQIVAANQDFWNRSRLIVDPQWEGFDIGLIGGNIAGGIFGKSFGRGLVLGIHFGINRRLKKVVVESYISYETLQKALPAIFEIAAHMRIYKYKSSDPNWDKWRQRKFINVYHPGGFSLVKNEYYIARGVHQPGVIVPPFASVIRVAPHESTRQPLFLLSFPIPKYFIKNKVSYCRSIFY